MDDSDPLDFLEKNKMAREKAKKDNKNKGKFQGLFGESNPTKFLKDMNQNLDGFMHNYTYQHDQLKYTSEDTEFISSSESKVVRKLLTGKETGSLPISWKQGFYFNDSIHYGSW